MYGIHLLRGGVEIITCTFCASQPSRLPLITCLLFYTAVRVFGMCGVRPTWGICDVRKSLANRVSGNAFPLSSLLLLANAVRHFFLISSAISLQCLGYVFSLPQLWALSVSGYGRDIGITNMQKRRLIVTFTAIRNYLIYHVGLRIFVVVRKANLIMKNR